MKLAIIIVNYNTPAETVDCLLSLRECIKPKDLELKTILVDNGSRDDSVDIIEQKFPEVRTIALESNTGFAGGNNVGLREAMELGFDWYMLLNSDTEVSKTFLKDTMTTLTKTKFDVFSPKIYFAKGFEYHKDRYQESDLNKVLWYAGGLLDRNNVYGTHRGVDEVDHGQYDQATATDFATGACLVIKHGVLKNIGLLDEDFFLYLEDLEWCERARKDGFKIGYEPHIKVWHKVSSSSGGIGSTLNDYFITRNRMLFGVRYLGLRTSFALIREAIRLYFTGTKFQKMALTDYFTHNLGKGNYFKKRDE
jgi:GT2 family glycosyltransferase